MFCKYFRYADWKLYAMVRCWGHRELKNGLCPWGRWVKSLKTAETNDIDGNNSNNKAKYCILIRNTAWTGYNLNAFILTYNYITITEWDGYILFTEGEIGGRAELVAQFPLSKWLAGLEAVWLQNPCPWAQTWPSLCSTHSLQPTLDSPDFLLPPSLSH